MFIKYLWYNLDKSVTALSVGTLGNEDVTLIKGQTE